MTTWPKTTQWDSVWKIPFPDLILVTNMKEAFHTMKHQLDELKEIIETLQPIRKKPEKVIISY